MATGFKGVGENVGTSNDRMKTFNDHVGKVTSEASNAKDGLDKMFALSMLDSAMRRLQEFGKSIGRWVGEGMEDARDKSAAVASFIQGALINNPAIREAGEQAVATFSEAWESKVSEKAIEIGLNTTFTDNEIAQGMAILARSGVDAQHIIDGVADSMAKVAMVGGVEVPEAAKHMVSLYNIFGKQLNEDFGGDTQAAFNHVADVVTNSLQSSGVSLSSFMNSLSYAGTAAAQSGHSFADTSAVITLFAKSGVSGSKAGTGLRRMLTNLTPSTDKAAEAIGRLAEKYGGAADIFYEADGTMKSLVDVQALLFDMFKDKSPQEQLTLVKEIFGQYAIGQAIILATSDDFAELTSQLNQTGTAQEYVDRIMGSSAGIHDRFTEAIKTLQETMGTFTNEGLDPLKKKFADLLENYLTKTPEEVQRVLTSFVTFGAGALVLATTIGILTLSMTLFQLALKSTGLNFVGFVLKAGKMVLTLGLIGLAIVALIAIGVYLYTHWDEIKAKAAEVWASVKQSVGKFVDSVVTWFKELPAKIEGFVLGIGTWLSENIPKAWDAIVTWTVETWEGIKKWFADLPGKIGYWIGFVAGYLSEAIPKAWTAFKTWLSETWTSISTWFTELPGKLVSGIKTVGTWLGEKTIELWNFAKTWLPVVWDFVLDWTVGLPAKLLALIIKYAPKILEAGIKIGEAILDGIKSALGSIGSFITNLITGAIDAGKRAWEGFKEGFGAGKVEASVNVGGSPGGIIEHAVGGIFTKPTQIGQHMFGEAGPEALIPLNERTLERFGLSGSARGDRQQTVNITINYNGTPNRQGDDYLINQIRRVVAT